MRSTGRLRKLCSANCFQPSHPVIGILATVDKDAETGEVTFVETWTEVYAAVETLWCPVSVNEVDFKQVQNLKGNVLVVTNPFMNVGIPVVVKIATWPWGIPYLEAETTAYRAICDTGVGPRFLAHITEGINGRVIGFAMEWIPNARAAGPGDLEACKEALGRLHALGFILGDINNFNFLVRDG